MRVERQRRGRSRVGGAKLKMFGKATQKPTPLQAKYFPSFMEVAVQNAEGDVPSADLTGVDMPATTPILITLLQFISLIQNLKSPNMLSIIFNIFLLVIDWLLWLWENTLTKGNLEVEGIYLAYKLMSQSATKESLGASWQACLWLMQHCF